MSLPVLSEPSEPTITGALAYPAKPFAWRVVTSGADLSVISNANDVRRSGWWFLAVSLVGVIVFLVVLSSYFNFSATPFQWIGIGTLLCVPTCGVVGYLNWDARREAARGPWLVYRSSDRSIEIPRNRLRVPLDRVLGWQLVSGPWWWGEGKGRYSYQKVVTEFQMIFEENGTRKMIAILSANGKGALDAEARAISDVTGIGLVQALAN